MDLGLRRLVTHERNRWAGDVLDLDAINQQYAFQCHQRSVTAGAVLQCLASDDPAPPLFTLALRYGYEAALRALIAAVVTHANQQHHPSLFPPPDLIFGEPGACTYHQHQLKALAYSLRETRLLPVAEMGYLDSGPGAILLRQQAPWAPCVLRYLPQDKVASLGAPELARRLQRLIATYTPQRQMVIGVWTGPWLWGEIVDASLLAYPRMTGTTDRLTVYEAWVCPYIPDMLSCAAASQAHQRRGIVFIGPCDELPGKYQLGWLDTSRCPPDPTSDLAAWVQTYDPTRQLLVLAVRQWAQPGSRWGTGALLVLDLQSGHLRQLETRGTPRGPAVFLPQPRLP
jgi:hypothetical protein